MNKLFQYIYGYCCVVIAGAEPSLVLNRLTKKRIAFWAPVSMDSFHMRIYIYKKDTDAVREFAAASLCDVVSCQNIGIAEHLRKLFQRPVLWIATLLAVILVLFGQQYLLFFDVVGTETVSEQQIVRALDVLDIGVGIYGPNIKPKWIKDHVLNMLPEIQWITVTQNGCKAQVVVREREPKPETINRKGFSNIVSSRDAIITEQSVLKGQPLKKVGDTVLAGEMLVSGVVNLEKIFTIVYAQAEIYGRTWYKKNVVIPVEYCSKTVDAEQTRCYWLEIGNRRIKLFGNSSISYADCDKMIDRSALTLPGGHILPITLVTERFTPYKTKRITITQDEAARIGRTYATGAVQQNMCAGEILEQTDSIVCGKGVYQYLSVMECREMIAVTIDGKWNEEDFKND